MSVDAARRGGGAEGRQRVAIGQDQRGGAGSEGGVLAALQRWEASGAVWRVVAVTPERVTVSLCRCDGGEEVERLSSSESALIAYLGQRRSSEDEG